ncbi:response regulator [Roseococcus sp. YIM B11640]|uniref:response regulator n=1 Tax=Roseococcus sp. YIM B11640 TaxID=3133973 RepID=UPI003C7E8100
MSPSKRSWPTTTDTPARLDPEQIARDPSGNMMLHGAGDTILGAGMGELLAAVAAAVPVGVTIADATQPDYPLVFVNPAFCRITGYAASEALGRNCRFLQGRGTAREQVLELRHAIRERRPITIEIVNHRRNGRRFVNELHVAPVLDATGEPLAYLGIQRDLTVLRRTEAKARSGARAAERVRRRAHDFLTLASHELRTPLHSAAGMLALLLETPLDAEQRAYAEAAQRATHTLAHGMEELRDLSQLEGGQLQILAAPFQLGELLKGIVQELAPAAEEGSIQLGYSLDHLLPPRVKGDAARIRQVLRTLTENAIRNTQRGGVEIRVTALPDGHVGFAVTDTGSGLAPPLGHRLFGRAPMPGERPGAGLSLTIARQLVSLMGGELALDNAPGRGSTYFFDLALARLPSAKLAAPARPARVARARILVAEDGRASQLVVASMLRKAGHSVDLAHDGVEAVAQAQANDYDLILMDLRMPLLDGYAATRAIRHIEGPRGRVAILAMTASSLPDDVERCLAAGMDGHLAKPVFGAQLLAAVDHAIGNRPPVPQPAGEPGATPPLIDRETLEELRSAVGPGRLPNLIDVFAAETRERVRRMRGLSDPERIEDEAQGLRSAAATFGALALRDAAGALEEACHSGRPERWAGLLEGLTELTERSLAAFPARGRKNSGG